MFLFILAFAYSFTYVHRTAKSPVAGAWELMEGSRQQLLIFTDNYFTFTTYDKGKKEFVSSFGGTYQVQNNQLNTKLEFNSSQDDKVPAVGSHPFSIETDKLTVEMHGGELKWKRIDDGSGPLAGAWRISGRMQNDKMTPMEGGPRKTLKILSGTKFQWIAMNTETKEFFGTGGGSYTFANGKYTETIEFFSRDSSRVGVSLSFDGKVENDQWHHSGTSSRGEKIHEIWSRVK